MRSNKAINIPFRDLFIKDKKTFHNSKKDCESLYIQKKESQQTDIKNTNRVYVQVRKRNERERVREKKEKSECIS